jgi:hypothetical protein
VTRHTLSTSWAKLAPTAPSASAATETPIKNFFIVLFLIWFLREVKLTPLNLAGLRKFSRTVWLESRYDLFGTFEHKACPARISD